ncbi:hypothetical protein F5Y05DRAFT_411717 [Hypoxylon sp. FL0543]|nr:hypothetical protein F5Y05DRAFT_411717 [Hypoxylon sp. FL0543]
MSSSHSPTEALRVQCHICQASVAATGSRFGGFNDDNTHRHLCYGCSVLPPADQQHPMAPYWGAILNHWRPGTDSRAWNFVRDRRHGAQFLALVHELAKNYPYADTVTMVNSVAMERIRHGRDKRREVIPEDWACLLKVCQHLGFEPAYPHEVLRPELEKMNLRENGLGFVEAGEPREDDDVKGVCSNGRTCHNILPYTDRVVFTWSYRHRRGCNIIA